MIRILGGWTCPLCGRFDTHVHRDAESVHNSSSRDDSSPTARLALRGNANRPRGADERSTRGRRGTGPEEGDGPGR